MSTRTLRRPGENRIYLEDIKDCTKEQIFAQAASGFWIANYMDNEIISLGAHDDETILKVIRNLGKYYFVSQIAAESLTSKSLMFDILDDGDLEWIIDAIRHNFDVPTFLFDCTIYHIQRDSDAFSEYWKHDWRHAWECDGIDTDEYDEYTEEQFSLLYQEATDEEASLSRLWLRLERHLWLNKIEWSQERRELAQQAIIANRAIIPELNPSGIAAFMVSLLSDDQVEAHELPELEISL